MKKHSHVLKHFGLLVFIFAFAFPPAAFANHLSSSDDGDFGSWRGSRQVRSRINDLDDDKVDSVPLPILFGLTRANLSRNFGDLRSGGRAHEGLDIMAPKRALIVSPTEAVVIRTGDGASSGLYVYTANPGGETFAYMHLDEIADIDEGDVLNVGDLIGYVGNTGNASGGATHLHFEIHDDGDPTDPYPRLTGTFTLEKKLDYLEEILGDVDDEEELAEDLVRMYRSEFVPAINQGLDLPEEIEDILPANAAAATGTYVASASGDLTIGARGPAVVTLQKFLITKGVGSASRIVADGAFGPMTQKALAEYQASVGIKPAAGYYGAITRAYISAHP